jgi:hypothetical protein
MVRKVLEKIGSIEDSSLIGYLIVINNDELFLHDICSGSFYTLKEVERIITHYSSGIYAPVSEYSIFFTNCLQKMKSQKRNLILGKLINDDTQR